MQKLTLEGLRLSAMFVVSAIVFVFCSNTYAVPTSERSLKVSNRTLPTLERQLKERGLNLGSPIYIRSFKEEKEMEVWVKRGNQFVKFKTYPICSYGSGRLGPKFQEGDGQAPEGFYEVSPNQMNPWSSFHLAFNVGYPNEFDRYHNRTGTAIMVHGKCVSIGCFAVTDELVEEVYLLAEQALKAGQKSFRFDSFPFRMTETNLWRHANNQYLDFWKNLKVGYDLFNMFRVPPEVDVINGAYVLGIDKQLASNK